MVIVDRLSRKKRFIGLDSLSVGAVVQAFIEWVWREEGYPTTIVSDRGTQFVSYFWRRLCERMGTTPKLSTAWHPETDGQTENANADLKAYLRAYVNYNQNDWLDYLPTARIRKTRNKETSQSSLIGPSGLAHCLYVNRSLQLLEAYNSAAITPQDCSAISWIESQDRPSLQASFVRVAQDLLDHYASRQNSRNT